MNGAKIKIWHVKKEGTLKPITLESIHRLKEKEFEDMIVKNPELLEEGIRIICRQPSGMPGTPDLLGIDDNGNLVIFELKGGKLTRDSVAQIIEYVSYLNDLSVEDLCAYISQNSGKEGTEKIENFEKWYRDNFSKEVEEIKGQPIRMILVGLEVDPKVRKMIKFLNENGINIDIFTFEIFRKDKEEFWAKIEFQKPPAKSEKEKTLETLQQLITELQATKIVEEVRKFIKSNWSETYEVPLKTGYSYCFSEITEKGTSSARVYANIYLDRRKPKTVYLKLQKRAVDLLSEDEKKNLKVTLKFKEDKYGHFYAEFEEGKWQESEELRQIFEKIKEKRKEKEKQLNTNE